MKNLFVILSICIWLTCAQVQILVTGVSAKIVTQTQISAADRELLQKIDSSELGR